MTDDTIDPPLLELPDPALARPLPPALATARNDILGHLPGEPERLVRHVLASYGRAELAVFGRVGVGDAVDRVASGAAEARVAAREAREAAGV